MNQVILSGRLVYEPELKEVGNGKIKLPLRLAVSRNDKAKTVDFINAQAWNNTAEFVAKYFHKGDPIEVTGKLQVSNYEKQDGTKATDVYVLINEAGFVLSKGKAEATSEGQAGAQAPEQLPFEI